MLLLLAPEWLTKNNANAAAQCRSCSTEWQSSCCSLKFNSCPSEAEHSRPSHLIYRLELRCIPIQDGSTPNSTYLSKGRFWVRGCRSNLDYGGRVAMRRAFWKRRGDKCSHILCQQQLHAAVTTGQHTSLSKHSL